MVEMSKVLMLTHIHMHIFQEDARGVSTEVGHGLVIIFALLTLNAVVVTTVDPFAALYRRAIAHAALGNTDAAIKVCMHDTQRTCSRSGVYRRRWMCRVYKGISAQVHVLNRCLSPSSEVVYLLATQ